MFVVFQIWENEFSLKIEKMNLTKKNRTRENEDRHNFDLIEVLGALKTLNRVKDYGSISEKEEVVSKSIDKLFSCLEKSSNLELRKKILKVFTLIDNSQIKKGFEMILQKNLKGIIDGSKERAKVEFDFILEVIGKDLTNFHQFFDYLIDAFNATLRDLMNYHLQKEKKESPFRIQHYYLFRLLDLFLTEERFNEKGSEIWKRKIKELVRLAKDKIIQEFYSLYSEYLIEIICKLQYGQVLMIDSF